MMITYPWNTNSTRMRPMKYIGTLWQSCILYFKWETCVLSRVCGCGSLPWNPPTRCEHRYPIRNSTNLQVFVGMQHNSHSNPYAQSTTPSLLWYGLVNRRNRERRFLVIRPGFYTESTSRHQERYVVETSVSTTTWTSVDANSEQDLQSSSATSEEAYGKKDMASSV
jgi:hypothetical protein